MPRIRPTYLFAIFLYCAGIFILSAQPHPPQTIQSLLDIPGGDKVLHAILYAGLALVTSIALRRADPPATPKFQFWVPIAFALLIGSTDEIHQIFVPTRHFDPLDLLADTTGATIIQLIPLAPRPRIFDRKRT